MKRGYLESRPVEGASMPRNAPTSSPFACPSSRNDGQNTGEREEKRARRRRVRRERRRNQCAKFHCMKSGNLKANTANFHGRSIWRTQRSLQQIPFRPQANLSKKTYTVSLHARIVFTCQSGFNHRR